MNAEAKIYVPLENKLKSERKEAIDARRIKGLDAVWEKARKQYQGIDEVNEPNSVEGLSDIDGSVILTGFQKKTDDDRSTVFDNITRTYTETGYSKVLDILLPTNKRPWDLEDTPVMETRMLEEYFVSNPDLVKSLDPALLQSNPEALAGAVKYIEDALIEASWQAELRDVVKEAAVVGAGVLKGPVPVERKLSSRTKEILSFIPADSSLHYQLKYAPTSEMVPVENCYPDPLCGANIQNGSYFWEKIPEVSRRQLEAKLRDPKYDAGQIKLCLKEGPKDLHGKECKPNAPFEVWIRHGRVKIDDFLLLSQDQISEDPDDSEYIFALVEMCNGRIIKLCLPALEAEEFPYDVFPWEPRPDSWDGIGIPERLETPQRGLNAALRAAHDNMGWAVGFQVVYREGKIEPVSGNSYKPEKYKVWRELSDAFNQSADKPAFYTIEFPDHLPSIMPMIEYWLRRAEHVANLPLILQGQASSESVGVTQAMTNAATTNLRDVVKSVDTRLIVPHITRYYEWSQSYGPDSIKGDARVKALGSSVLILRELQQQLLVQLLDRSLVRQFKLSPEKIMMAVLEGNQLDFAQLRITEDEDARLAEIESQPEPQVQAAQIEAEWRKHDSTLDHELGIMKLQLEALEKNLNFDAEMSKQATELEKEELRSATQIATAPEPQGQPPKPLAMEEPEIDIDSALKMMGLEV